MLLLRAQLPTARVAARARSRSAGSQTHCFRSNRFSHVAVRALSDPQETVDPSEKLAQSVSEATKFVQSKWDATEDKPAAIIVGASVFVALYAVSSVIDAVDKIPVFSTVLELIGLVVSGWLGFRLITAEADRKELLLTLERFAEKVTGSKK